MTKKIIPYIIVIVSIVLLMVNIFKLDFDNLNQNSFYGIISNIFLIALGTYLIYQQNKNG